MELRDRFKAISDKILFEEPMRCHTSFKIGGNADMLAVVRNADEIKALISLAKETDTPYTVMGNGSNILVSDSGIRGLVIKICGGMNSCKIDGTTVYAEAGIMMSKLANEAARASLSGFEPLSGIPGTLGGGIFMNAGAYGGEIKNVIKSVTYLDDGGEIKTIDNEQCCFGYRKSVFSGGGKYILSAELQLKEGDAEEIRAAMADYNKRRSDKQPLSQPSAGSTFKRPEGYFAGKLIQDAGLMGYRVGGAMVSDKHAGFVVNAGGATAGDVLKLIEDVKSRVLEKFGVELEPEVRFLGENVQRER